MRIYLTALLVILCSSALWAQHSIFKQAHRGGRGLMPENTIAAMKNAIDLGADVLELDVVISKDKQVVVSHDAYFASDFSLKPSGDTISVAEQKDLILYGMPYEEIKKYDVGSRHHPQFPEQRNFPAYRPLLSELIDSADSYARKSGKASPYYNIEIKSQPETDGVQQPKPQEFVDLVIKVCGDRQILKRMDIQSFDLRPLVLIHKLYPAIPISYLTANARTIAENLNALGFTPDIYSPYYKTVDAEAVQFCHGKGIKIIPWTVNTKEQIGSLTALGVDGIISDYPSLF